jgi:hypothetical protein
MGVGQNENTLNLNTTQTLIIQSYNCNLQISDLPKMYAFSSCTLQFPFLMHMDEGGAWWWHFNTADARLKRKISVF